MFRFERTQILPVGLDQAWEFFSHPANLARITPPDLDFRVTSAECDSTYAGQIITYTVSPLGGFRIGWITEITHLQRPVFFVDEQRFGPYRLWQHQHHFREVPGGVEMRDLIHYLLPRLPFMELVNRRIVAPRLKRIFDYRAEALQAIFPIRQDPGPA